MTEIEIATPTGRQVGLNADAIKQLGSGLRGAALLQGDDGYDASRKIYNAMIDRRPVAIARCASAEGANTDLAAGFLLSSNGGITQGSCADTLKHNAIVIGRGNLKKFRTLSWRHREWTFWVLNYRCAWL